MSNIRSNSNSSSSSPILSNSTSPSSTSTSSDMSDEIQDKVEVNGLEEEEIISTQVNNKENKIENEQVEVTKEDTSMMILDEEDSSEVEIVEPELDEASTSKRKLDDPKPISNEAKKAKVSNGKASSSSKLSKPETKKAIAAKAKEKEEAILVELKNGKFNLKQKALGNDSTSSTMRGRLAFTDYFATLFKDESFKIENWPVEYHGVVARLIHESDKTITALVKHVQKQLVEYVEGSMAAREDSQESQEKESISAADRIPITSLKILIESLATRTNYGLELSDLTAALLKEFSEIPAALQIWRWEIHNSELLPAELESKLEKRKSERLEVKSAALKLYFALPLSEQKGLLSKSQKKGGVWKMSAAGSDAMMVSSDGPAIPSSTPLKSNQVTIERNGGMNEGGGDGIASGSGSTSNGNAPLPPFTPAASTSTSTVAVPKKKKLPVEKIEKVFTEEQKALKAEKEAEKEVRRIAREAAAAEKATIAAEKKAKEDQKKAKELAKVKETTKQSGFFNKFFVKKSISPGPSSSNRGSSVPVQASSFEKTFLSFAIRSNTTVAPVNKFKKYETGNCPELKINSLETLSAEDSIKAFLSDVPRSHLLPDRNAHPIPQVSVRETVRAINDADAMGADSSEFYKLLADRSKIKVKMLKFKDDVRPGYSGTWTKTSKVVGPRTPFGLDTALLRYDYDSEEEWEEEEPDLNAEDVDSSGEISVEEDSDALSDDWLCEDDEVDYEVGHEGGEDEMIMMDVDGDGDVLIVEARKKILDRENKAKAAKEAAKKRKTLGPMAPVTLGPMWESKIGFNSIHHFSSMRIQFLNDPREHNDVLGYNPETQKSIDVAVKVVNIPSTLNKDVKPILNAPAGTSKATPSTSSSTSTESTRVRPPPKALPSNLLARFVSLVHQSDKTKAVLTDDIFVDLKEHKIAKNTIMASITEIAAKGKGNKGSWIVNSDILAQLSTDMVID